ncbi:transcriptional repressor LexA [Roseateles depolymerans]|uniref:LexA family transcriptional regulator n=1 Tax=Roseateles depolymerans TaxID=76731 RepID=A0A0U3MTN8_9BURK|nr:transcriptional repressor LexA [Roseateles depolymerans]ALV07722.1 LexA family transcriptional regulator [Roseateles depolymerans]REG22054.1 repressor LexA [Roseateles depolymerans]
MQAVATANDQRHLAILRTHWKAHKSFPSLANLAGQLGMSSTGSVFEMVARLEDAGYLTRRDGRVAPGRRFFAYPVLGTVRAGGPQPASDEELDFLSVEELLIREPNKTAMCHVRGDSMRDAGLLDGDVVIVETQSIVEPGDIVVAAVDGQLTVKYLRRDGGSYFLEPANPSYEPIYPQSSLDIVGLVTGSVRTIKKQRR